MVSLMWFCLGLIIDVWIWIWKEDVVWVWREERAEEKERMREISRIKKYNKILIFFLQYRYRAILHVELHCSSIANFFTILGFYKF